MHTPPYAVLLNHSAAEMLSSLEVREDTYMSLWQAPVPMALIRTAKSAVDTGAHGPVVPSQYASVRHVALVSHVCLCVCADVQVSEHMWVARVEVTGMVRGGKPGDVAVYEFTMVQRLGGVHDGYW